MEIEILKYDIWFGFNGSRFELRNEFKKISKNLSTNFSVLMLDYNHIDVINDTNGSTFFYQKQAIDLPKLCVPMHYSWKSYQNRHWLQELELNGTIMANSIYSIDDARFKNTCAQQLMRNNIDMPRQMTVNSIDDKFYKMVEQYIKFPCILKILIGCHGKGVVLCRNKKELEIFCDYNIAQWTNQITNLMIQECITESLGRDLRVIVIGNEVVGGMSRSSVDGDFRANIATGSEGRPYTVSNELKDLCLKIMKILNLKVAGIDFLFSERGLLVNEVNPTPEFAKFSEVTGIDMIEKLSNYYRSLLT